MECVSFLYSQLTEEKPNRLIRKVSPILSVFLLEPSLLMSSCLIFQMASMLYRLKDRKAKQKETRRRFLWNASPCICAML
jgi:hypothetical protein